MGAFFVAIIILAISIFIFFNAMILGINTVDNNINSKIYINIQYLIATVLLCSAFVLLGISETYRKISKIFTRIEKLFSKNDAHASMAIQQLKEKLTGSEKKNIQKIKCPKCNNFISIENDFKDKFYCPHCGVKLSF